MATCGSCGRENPADARFCNSCGAPVAEASLSREQRKVVTVLFCDVTGSTALGESTRPGGAAGAAGAVLRGMREIVERHGGSVEKFIGDAVMAVFGVPLVHEDDALARVPGGSGDARGVRRAGRRGADRSQHGGGRDRDGGAAGDR